MTTKKPAKPKRPVIMDKDGKPSPGFSRYYYRLSENGRRVIEDMKADPDLMDMKTTVAMQIRTAAETIEDPDDEELDEIVKNSVAAGKPITRREARRALYAAQSRALLHVQHAQEGALKQLRFSEVMLQVMMPLLLELGLRFRNALKRAIPDETAYNAVSREIDLDLQYIIGKMEEGALK